MSFIDRSQPREPADLGARPADDELPLPPPRHDDAPPLTDETDTARIMRLGRHLTEANKELLEGLRLLSEGKHGLYGAAMKRCADHLTEAGPLSRLLSRSFTAKQ